VKTKTPEYRARQRIYAKRYREKFPERVKNSQRVYRAKPGTRFKDNEYDKRYRREMVIKLRAEMIAAYGGRCTCCGEDESLFLTLEHLKNDGAEHRKKLGNQYRVLKDLKKRDWPKDNYTVLCYNCNCAKRGNHGICPHEVIAKQILKLA